MTLDELKEAVDRLTPEEQQDLQDYLNQRQQEAELNALLRALEAMREGITDEEFAEIEQAMNAARVEQLRAGLYLEPDRLTVEQLQYAVETVLGEPGIVSGIKRIQESYSDAGGVQQAADAFQDFKQKA